MNARRLAFAALLCLVPLTGLASEGAGDVNGLMVGVDGGYSKPTGHDYNNRLDDALDTLHAYVGYRMFGLLSLEAAATNVQAPVKSSKATATIMSYSLDARLYAPIGSVAPNVLVGYSPKADLHSADSFSEISVHGNGFILGAGLRMVVASKVYLTADFRHQFLRYQKGDITIPPGPTVSGTFDHELRGDVWSVLVGGGLQF